MAELTKKAGNGGDADAPPPARRHRRLFVDLGHPFGWGFTATVGALVALCLAYLRPAQASATMAP